jgi:hypothetical protein
MKKLFVVITMVAIILILSIPDTWAKEEDGKLQTRIAALEAIVSTLQTQITDLQMQLTSYQALFDYVRVDTNEINGLAGPHVIFEGANVHIRSGSGETSDALSPIGLGNLIIGYNEENQFGTTPRTGSHNLVVGSEHGYPSYGGFVAGFRNDITGAASSVSGGTANTASGENSSVSGGVTNTASGQMTAVCGGYTNKAIGVRSSVSGGRANEASGDYSSVSGGYGNIASGIASSVSGGSTNKAIGNYSSVSGDKDLEVSSDYGYAP